MLLGGELVGLGHSPALPAERSAPRRRPGSASHARSTSWRAPSRVEHEAEEHLGADRVQPVGERCDGAEVAAAPAAPRTGPRSPPSLAVTMLPSAVTTSAATRLSTAEAVLAPQPADPSRQGQPGDPGLRDGAARGRQPVLLGGHVDVGERGAALGARTVAATSVRLDLAHRREVDHDPVVADRVTRDAVAAARTASGAPFSDAASRTAAAASRRPAQRAIRRPAAGRSSRSRSPAPRRSRRHAPRARCPRAVCAARRLRPVASVLPAILPPFRFHRFSGLNGSTITDR